MKNFLWIEGFLGFFFQAEIHGLYIIFSFKIYSLNKHFSFSQKVLKT